MARTAALLPCSPADLLDLDLPMFNETARQVQQREQEWTRRDEMAAQQIEMIHLLYRTLIQVNASKHVPIKPFRFPRPGDAQEPVETVVSHRQMRALMTSGGLG